jgi:hypothetical protein
LKIIEVVKPVYSRNTESDNKGISWENFKAKICTDLEMSEVTNITLCNIRQPGNRKQKYHKNFWTVVVHWL